MVRGNDGKWVSIHEILWPVGPKHESPNELDSLVVPRHSRNCPCWDRSQGDDTSGAAVSDELGIILLAVLDGGILVWGSVEPVSTSRATPDRVR